MKKSKSNVIAVLIICLAAFLATACGGKAESNRLYPIVKDGKWGYINSQGKIVIEPQFDAAYEFSDGLARVSRLDKSGNQDFMTKDDKDGYIDASGKFVIEPQFVTQGNLGANNFSEGMAVVQTDYTLDKSSSPPTARRNYACIDKTGKIVFKLDPKYSVTSNFSDGRLLFQDESTKKYGFLDKTGQIVIEAKYTTARPFSEGLAAVADYLERNGSKDIYDGFIDPNGKTVIDFQFKEAASFSEGLARVLEDGEHYGFIDKTDKQIIKPQFRGARDFHDGLAVIPEIASYKFTDKDGKVIYGDYGAILTDFAGGTALIADDKKKLQIIGKSGKITAPVDAAFASEQIDSVGKSFEGGLLRIETKDRTLYYINTDGKVVWQGKL